jgi:hypothetical protein
MAPADGRPVFLEAVVPEARIARDEVKAGETTVVVPTMLLHR